MSGHSHWHSIRHQKAITDAKKGKAFSKLIRFITIAAKEKGGDPAANPGLRTAIEKAKELNLPKENIDKAIKRGTGELGSDVLETITIEGYGPGGIAIMVEGITDNSNRSIGEIKQIFTKNGGKAAGEGAVKWMFERKAVLSIVDKAQLKEDLELAAIEVGAQDMQWDNEVLYIYAAPENLDLTKKNLHDKGITVSSATLDWLAKEKMEVNPEIKEKCEKLFEALDEHDDVQDIYSNLKN